MADYYSISILFIDDTGKYHYEDTCSYLIIAAEGSAYTELETFFIKP